jgi:hypothetical protein
MKLDGDKMPVLRRILEGLCEDEVSHKTEAISALGSNDASGIDNLSEIPFIAQVWIRIVDIGSRGAVFMSRKL